MGAGAWRNSPPIRTAACDPRPQLRTMAAAALRPVLSPGASWAPLLPLPPWTVRGTETSSPAPGPGDRDSCMSEAPSARPGGPNLFSQTYLIPEPRL